MYHEYYGLTSDPFRLATEPVMFYSNKSVRKARSYLQYGLQAGDGMVLVTGVSGIGKTSLIREFIKDIPGIQLEPIIIQCTHCTARELLANYAALLTGKRIYTDTEFSETLNLITHALIKVKADNKTALLILDDAHQLTDETLTTLKHLADLKLKGKHLVQLHLVGLPKLRDTILRRGHEQIHQRLGATCRIEPLTDLEGTEYIVRNLTAAGWRGSPKLCPRACKEINKTSMGIRRWINLSCSRLLLHGMANQKQELDLSDVREVLRELLQEDLLPAEIRSGNHLNKTASATFVKKTA